MKARLLQVLKFTMVLVLVAFTANFLPAASVQAAKPNDPPRGNNGTLKIHEQGTPSGTENNDPKVCSFNFEGFGFDPAQTGYIVIQEQNGPAEFGPYSFGPTDANGFYASNYFNDNIGPAIANGHYKATLYGKMLPNGKLQDKKAKSKVFKVNCKIAPTPLDPQVSVSVDSCAKKRKPTFATVTVTNPADGAGAAEYSVTIGLETQTVKIADGASQDLAFSNLSVGGYIVIVTGDDKTSAQQQFSVNKCAKKPKVKVIPGPCIEAGDNTGLAQIKIKNRNNYDVTYGITVGGSTQNVTVAAKSKEKVILVGLTVGENAITVLGSDGTRVKTSVDLNKCPERIAPELSIIAGPCIDVAISPTSSLTVRITNPNTYEVGYAVFVNGGIQIVFIPAGGSDEVTFNGLTTGNYSIGVIGSNKTLVEAQGTITNCPGQGGGNPTQPTEPTNPVEKPKTETPSKKVSSIPTTLPATGSSPIALIVTLLASTIVYVVALKIQRRRFDSLSKN